MQNDRFAGQAQEVLFPRDDYPPYGFLHTPTHTGTHPSGIVRSVPPLGFGIWTGGLDGYAMNEMRHINNYVSMLLPSVQIDGLLLCEREDFDKHGIELVSRYHSANIFSYDFTVRDARFSFVWYLQHENALTVQVTVDSRVKRNVALDLENRYGMNGAHWWGADEATIRYFENGLVAKILAYGDIFCTLSDLEPQCGITARQEEELRAWQRGELPLDGDPKATWLPDPAMGILRFLVPLEAGEERTFTAVLARGVNEKASIRTARGALQTAAGSFTAKLKADNAFYKHAPLLRGDWPEAWSRGWVMDFETLRMNVLHPAGIYQHPWDGMQVLNPRVVVGETAIDMLTLGYADLAAALDVMEGMFADAPDVYVPCSREDGSVNMIGEDGSECATAPIWGMPLRAIRILLSRSGNLQWLQRLYPRLKAYVHWWMEHRTDAEGWYHCNNSWESGQDGSARFVTKQNQGKGLKEAANAETVRTADLEAAMASAMEDMAEFAGLLGEQEDRTAWLAQAHLGRARVETMFVDSCYRDFDAVTGEPIRPENHYDLMLTMPVALGMATPEQKEKIGWLFEAYDQSMKREDFRHGYALYWPPILQTYTEALHRLGYCRQASETVAKMVGDAWIRNDSRIHWPGAPQPGLPAKYCMRIPGVGRENLTKNIELAGCENYGWGCLGPALVLENLLGLRPVDSLGQTFSLCPNLPGDFPDGSYAVTNLRHGAYRFDVAIQKHGETADVMLCFFAAPGKTVKVNGIALREHNTTLTVSMNETITIG